jgi:hypothetical protein
MPNVHVVETCQRCESPRVARVLASCADMCSIDLGGVHRSGYVPDDMGIGRQDIHFDYCLECGQIQGTFPLPPTGIETDTSRRP